MAVSSDAAVGDGSELVIVAVALGFSEVTILHKLLAKLLRAPAIVCLGILFLVS
jgi:hypothetical protein